jgi:succinoglycan biosynthesis transport protein ExoP
MNSQAFHPATAASINYGVAAASNKSLRDVLYMLWRRKAMILGIVLLSVLLTLVLLYQIVPRYTAKTLISMERRGVSVIELEAVTSGLPGDESTFNNEIEFLRSRNLAKMVIFRLGLDKVTEFSGEQTNSVLTSWINKQVEYFYQPSAIPQEKADTSSLDALQIGHSDEIKQLSMIPVSTVDRFLRRLKVSSTGMSSRVIEVSFTSVDARRSALVANTIANIYLEMQKKQKSQSIQDANLWLDNQLQVLRKSVRHSEQAVEDFRKEAGLLEGKDATLMAQQLSELNSQLVIAKTARVEAEARYSQIRQLADSEEGASSAAGVLDSVLVQELRQQQAVLERKEAKLSVQYGALHPKMIQINAEQRELQSLIDIELRKIVRSYLNKLRVAHAREESLRNSLVSLQKQVAEANLASVDLRALEREAKADQLLFESFLARFKETSLQDEMDSFQADSKIISYADIPRKHAYPRKGLILALVTITTSLVAVFFAFLLEGIDRQVRSSSELTQVTGLPSLGIIPLFKNPRRALNGEGYSKLEHCLLLESVRSIQSSLYFSGPGKNIRSVLVTSARPNEGKSFLSLALARFHPHNNKIVTLIDADLRRPSLHTRFSTSRENGLSEVLLGEAELSSVLQQDPETGLYFITAGRAVTDAASLLASVEMEKLMQILHNASDLVVVDSAPLMAVSDARYLSSLVDTTVFVTRWSSNNRGQISMAVKQLQSSSNNLSGVVLSQVNVKKHAGYGYADSGLYNGELRKYYAG